MKRFKLLKQKWYRSVEFFVHEMNVYEFEQKGIMYALFLILKQTQDGNHSKNKKG